MMHYYVLAFAIVVQLADAVPPGVGVKDRTPALCTTRKMTLKNKLHGHCRADGEQGRPKVRRDVPLQYPSMCNHAARHAIQAGCSAVYLLDEAAVASVAHTKSTSAVAT